MAIILLNLDAMSDIQAGIAAAAARKEQQSGVTVVGTTGSTPVVVTSGSTPVVVTSGSTPVVTSGSSGSTTDAINNMKNFGKEMKSIFILI